MIQSKADGPIPSETSPSKRICIASNDGKDDESKVLPESLRVKAMEIAVVFNPDDLLAFREETLARENNSDSSQLMTHSFVKGYEYSGSHAKRNIELIYRKAFEGNVSLSLESALRAVFAEAKPRHHVLLVSGFYVLHDLAELKVAGLEPGSCETDGPLGVLALARAFASRGVRVSIFTDRHTTPVMQAAYEAMLTYFGENVGDVAAQGLAKCMRILPPVSDAEAGKFLREAADVFPGEHTLPIQELQCRAICVAHGLKASVQLAWEGMAPEIDCLFAIERLGLPYKNIRGRDIAKHTEPIDFLWPLSGTDTSRNQGLGATEQLRTLSGVAIDALTLGIGDGGNEVGMGKVTEIKSIAQLCPPGSDFVALSENGCRRTCDYLFIGTVSNWAGSAFEIAAQVLFPILQSEPDYIQAMKTKGCKLSDLELCILERITRQPHRAVDGIHPTKSLSVDGMSFDPQHSGLYDYLWALLGHSSL